ncbi:TPA: hypothetical protein ACQ65G_001986 [Neisseria meningitidis]|uniref:Uncharacterized protein n=2 Tax=Neisseria meningitidis TaxID=487 RepID=A0A425AIA9_NEIME|nr:hypothetical protein [Neisseria meningitidis]RNK04409.1 hypothetical protein COI28_05815 [Neisseria meningitidis]RNK12982.1 hypothetical protein COI24_04790 [Neisseria meningitidis]RQJ56190.1 hypothetical protein COI16_11680 [Neisseria meningitidis]RQJ64349.1 hypothetical protein COI09_11140 [Neisseria meningitidis]RQJ72489.1 hypothetical protein COI08_07910 [Neisseria meningitidis]
MAKYAERGGLTQSRHDFTTPMPSETGFASNFKPENIVSDGKIVNNADKPAHRIRIFPDRYRKRCRLKAVSDGIVSICTPPL